MPERFAAAAALLREAIAGGAFPAASIEVGRGGRTALALRDGTADLRRRCPAGRSRDRLRSGLADQGHRDDDARRCAPSTTAGWISTIRVGKWLRDWRGADRDDVTIRDLLAHASGLTAYLPFFRDYTGRFEFEHAICSLPLEYAPRSQSLYSDLGFMLLGFILEDAQPLGPGLQRRARHDRSLSQPGHAVPPPRIVLHGGAASLQSAARLAGPHRADRDRRVARTTARRRGARREHVGARRRGGTRGAVRNGRGRRRLRPRGAAHDRRRADPRARRKRCARSSRGRTSRAARARSDGTRCSRRRRAARSSRRRRSATPASPGRRSGSTGSAISTWCS